jgi:hypothetical protein
MNMSIVSLDLSVYVYIYVYPLHCPELKKLRIYYEHCAYESIFLHTAVESRIAP